MALFLGSGQKALARVTFMITRLRDLLVGSRDRYRPEKHYMRGPGPKSKIANTNKQE
jgi:hypothetical protein